MDTQGTLRIARSYAGDGIMLCYVATRNLFNIIPLIIVHGIATFGPWTVIRVTVGSSAMKKT